MSVRKRTATIRTYTGAAINAGESDYTGAKQNIKAVDDAKFIGWTDIACTLTLGALQRNATGHPDAIKAVLTACQIPGLAVVSTSNGTISVMSLPGLTARTPTPGVAAAKCISPTSLPRHGARRPRTSNRLSGESL
jgi:hypothetical protein